MKAQSDTTDLVERLWASDAASALTNEAAREIESLRSLIREALLDGDVNPDWTRRASEALQHD